MKSLFPRLVLNINLEHRHLESTVLTPESQKSSFTNVFKKSPKIKPNQHKMGDMPHNLRIWYCRVFALTFVFLFQSKVNNDTGEPLDELDTETAKWVAGLGSKAKTVSEIVNTKDPAVSFVLILLSFSFTSTYFHKLSEKLPTLLASKTFEDMVLIRLWLFFREIKGLVSFIRRWNSHLPSIITFLVI